MNLRKTILAEHSKANCNRIVAWVGESQQRRNLYKPKLHEAVKRNTVRLLAQISIPQRLHGEVMSLCFDYISSPNEPVAIKAFSLTVLQNLSAQYPEIKQELKTIIEDRWEHESAAFKSRAKKIVQDISKK